MYGHKYTDEEKAFMAEFVPGHSYSEIQTAFTAKFGWEISIGQVNAYIGNHHLNTGRTGCFEKGHVPANKGKQMPADVYEKAKNTMFKKGHVPHNYRPVGSERINKDGYVEVKVKDPKTWKLKHRLVWEDAYGKIPRDCIVIFRDGNKQNLDLDNLILIKKSVNAVLNHTGLGACPGEVKDTAVKLAELKIQTSNARKKRKRK